MRPESCCDDCLEEEGTPADPICTACISARRWHDGTNLGSGEVRYQESLPVTAMMPFHGGVLIAFTDVPDSGTILLSIACDSAPTLNLGSRSDCVRRTGKGNLDDSVWDGVLTAFTNDAGPNFTMAFFNVYHDANSQLHIKRISGTSADGIQTVYLSNGALTSLAVNPFGGSSGRLRITRRGSVLSVVKITI